MANKGQAFMYRLLAPRLSNGNARRDLTIVRFILSINPAQSQPCIKVRSPHCHLLPRTDLHDFRNPWRAPFCSCEKNFHDRCRFQESCLGARLQVVKPPWPRSSTRSSTIDFVDERHGSAHTDRCASRSARTGCTRAHLAW
jgi:hypothetical protein